MTPITEIALVEALTRGMPRSGNQIGTLQQSDAELIRLPHSETVLAITTDSIAEEIEIGLYADPYLIGWMAVAVNASDLAAVGAEPLGILISETLPGDIRPEKREALQVGIRDACLAARLPVLGGDTNSARHFQVGGTAIGMIQDGRIVTRVGCRPGDLLFSTGPLGLGSVFAISRLAADACDLLLDTTYKPSPRLREGRYIRSIASACIDTSDGALAGVDQLMRLNNVGFVLWTGGALHPSANIVNKRLGLPDWMMLSGLHGEFELLFTVPPEDVDEVLSASRAKGWDLRLFGVAVSDVGVWIEKNGSRSKLDTGQIRNLFAEPFQDVQTCIGRLATMEEPCTQ